MSYDLNEISIEGVKHVVKKEVYTRLKRGNLQLTRKEFDQQFEKDGAVQFMNSDLIKRFPSKEVSLLRVNEEIENYSLTILDSMSELVKKKAGVL